MKRGKRNARPVEVVNLISDDDDDIVDISGGNNSNSSNNSNNCNNHSSLNIGSVAGVGVSSDVDGIEILMDTTGSPKGRRGSRRNSNATNSNNSKDLKGVSNPADNAGEEVQLISSKSEVTPIFLDGTIVMTPFGPGSVLSMLPAAEDVAIAAAIDNSCDATGVGRPKRNSKRPSSLKDFETSEATPDTTPASKIDDNMEVTNNEMETPSVLTPSTPAAEAINEVTSYTELTSGTDATNDELKENEAAVEKMETDDNGENESNQLEIGGETMTVDSATHENNAVIENGPSVEVSASDSNLVEVVETLPITSAAATASECATPLASSQISQILVESQGPRRSSRKRKATPEIVYRGKGMVSVQLPFGWACLNARDIRVLEPSEICKASGGGGFITAIDLARCNRYMMLNDNLINHFLALLRPLAASKGIGIESTYFIPSLQAIMKNTTMSPEKKSEKAAKLFRSAEGFKTIMIPVHGYLHWSLVIIHNIASFFELITKTDNYLRNFEMDASCEKSGACNVNTKISTSIVLLDSSKYHRTQEVAKTIRTGLQFLWGTRGAVRKETKQEANIENDSKPDIEDAPVVDSVVAEGESNSNTPPSQSMDTSSSQADNTSKQLTLNFKVDASAIPGFAPAVPQQENQVDCGVFLLLFAEKFISDPLPIDFALDKDSVNYYFGSPIKNSKGAPVNSDIDNYSNMWVISTQDIMKKRNDMRLDILTRKLSES